MFLMTRFLDSAFPLQVEERLTGFYSDGEGFDSEEEVGSQAKSSPRPEDAWLEVVGGHATA